MASLEFKIILQFHRASLLTRAHGIIFNFVVFVRLFAGINATPRAIYCCNQVLSICFSLRSMRTVDVCEAFYIVNLF